MPAFRLRELITESSDGVFKAAQGVSFCDDEFNDAELAILKKISDKYRTVSGQVMSKESHEPGGPWAAVWKDETSRGLLIPMEQLVEKALPEEEKNRRKLLRDDAQRNLESFSRLRAQLARA